MLLRMQKALRSKSAAQKRQVWEEQLEEKRQKLQQRDRDTQSGMYSGDLTFFSLIPCNDINMQIKANFRMCYDNHAYYLNNFTVRYDK